MRAFIGRRLGAWRRGQNLVEFALVLPIFLLLLFGMIDVGRLVYQNSTLSQAAREAARVASVEAYWVGRAGTPAGPGCNQPGGPTCPGDLTALRADVLAAANKEITPFEPLADGDLMLSCNDPTADPPDWTSPPYTCSYRTPQGEASVHVESEFTPITPVIGQILGTIPLAASATMIIN
jgi:hypothetical protein